MGDEKLPTLVPTDTPDQGAQKIVEEVTENLITPSTDTTIGVGVDPGADAVDVEVKVKI